MLTWRAASVVYCHEYPNRRYRRRRRRPPGKAQRRRAGVRACGAGVAARDQHHRRGARRRFVGRRSLARHAADFDRRRRLAALGAGDVVVHGTVRSPRRVSGSAHSRAALPRRYVRAPCSSAASGCSWRDPCCSASIKRAQGFFRFAAADTASESFKPKAISWVSRRRAAERVARPRDRARDLGHVSCRAVCGRLSRDDRAQRHRCGRAHGSSTFRRPRRSAAAARHGPAARRHRAPARVRHRGACRRWSASPR